jgi:hypothetical protein
MSFRDKVRSRLHRWVDGVGMGSGGGGGVHGFDVSIPDVGGMGAADEADRPEQEREYEEFQAEQKQFGLPIDS